MDSWKKVWRDGLAPLLSEQSLTALRDALANDDQRLIQGATTMPPPLQSISDWPCEAACAIGYCGWQGEGLATIEEVDEFFARMCQAIDQRLGEWAGVRWFTNWIDETPRAEAFPLLLEEVRLEIGRRHPLQEIVHVA